MKYGGDVQQWAESIQELFINWENRYHGKLVQKKGVKDCWLKLLKITCWCIWLERNQRIFQNKSQPEWKITTKINALLGEVVRSKKIPNNNAELTEKENKWMQSLNIQPTNSIASNKLEDWEIRMDKSQFENWLRERKIFKLFSDGASKGNPGRAGGGGVVINPKGKVEIEYSWNIGYDFNNMAETYGLWQGLK